MNATTLRETQTRWQDLKSYLQAKEIIDGLSNAASTKEDDYVDCMCLYRS